MKKKLRLEPGEHVVISTVAHPAKLLRPVMVLILAVFLHGLLQRMLQVRWRPLDQPWTSIHTVLEAALSIALVLVILLAVLRPVIRWATTRFVLTSRRLMLVGGAAPKDGVRIPLAWLHRVDAHVARGPVGNAGIGTLSADFGQAGTLRLTYAARVLEFGRLIEAKAQAVRHPAHQGPYSPYGSGDWPGPVGGPGVGAATPINPWGVGDEGPRSRWTGDSW